MRKFSNVFLATTALFLSLLFCRCNLLSEQKADGKDAATGSNASLIGQPMEPITDSDGQTYQTVKIGNQLWMAENLRRTIFECEDSIKVQFTNGIERGPAVKFYDGSPRYAYYENDPSRKLGVLYNFSVLEKCQVCPLGYKLPAKADWEALMRTIGGGPSVGNHLLKGGATGFNADLGGRIDSYGSVMASSYGFWWSADSKPDDAGKNKEVYVFEINQKGLVNIKGQDVRSGNYVRCIKK